MYRELTDAQIYKFSKIWKIAYPDNVEGFMTRYKYFCHITELGLAVVSKTLNRESNITKLLKLCWYSPLYLISSQRRQSQFKTFVTSGDMELLIKIAKFTGNSLSRFVFYWVNPWIKFHQKIYIGKNYQRQTILGLNKTLDDFLMLESSESQATPFKKKRRFSFSGLVTEDLKLKEETFNYRHKPGLICLSKF